MIPLIPVILSPSSLFFSFPLSSFFAQFLPTKFDPCLRTRDAEAVDFSAASASLLRSRFARSRALCRGLIRYIQRYITYGDIQRYPFIRSNACSIAGLPHASWKENRVDARSASWLCRGWMARFIANACAITFARARLEFPLVLSPHQITFSKGQRFSRWHWKNGEDGLLFVEFCRFDPITEKPRDYGLRLAVLAASDRRSVLIYPQQMYSEKNHDKPLC